MEEFDFEFEADFGNDFDEELERTAFENTYKILLGIVTVDQLLDNESMQGGSKHQHISTAMLINPFSKRKVEKAFTDVNLIDDMIDYYVGTEEYEKCAKLVKLKKKIKC